mmetsp:Transcript_18995/g.31769  ORF Transcript_18995/g.31769 Transcript_18995/m.31769 type:complete len:1018 (-) Transcript_18995:914-3967(-)
MNLRPSKFKAISSIVLPSPTTSSLTADSGASGNYVAMKDAHSIHNIRPARHKAITVSLPDGSKCASTHVGDLPFPQLPKPARHCDIFPSFDGSLLSIGSLADHGALTVFTEDAVHVLDAHGKVLLQGPRDPITRTYTVPFPATSTGHRDTRHIAAPAIYHEDNAARVRYYSATMGHPVLSTFLHAADKGWLPFPATTITPQMIRKNPPQSVATPLGHLHQQRPLHLSASLPRRAGHRKSPGPNTVIHHKVYDINDMNAMDLAGRLPVQTRRKHNYQLVSVGANYIHVTMLRSRSDSDMCAAYSQDLQFWKEHNLKPQSIIHDNELSAAVKDVLHTADVRFELVPPGTHRANPAERAISTWKDHFIATLCGVDPDFPLIDLDLLVPQAEMTLNMMRASAANHEESAWNAVHGRYDFTQHPFAPLGTKVVTHDKPDQRASWDTHGEIGFYVGPAMEHYRCFLVLVRDTHKIRTTDTVHWLPQHFIMPGASPTEVLTAATNDLIKAIKAVAHLPPTILDGSSHHPLDHLLPTLTQQLAELNNIFPPEDQRVVPTTAREQRVVDPTAGEQRVGDTAAREQRVSPVAPPPGLNQALRRTSTAPRTTGPTTRSQTRHQARASRLTTRAPIATDQRQTPIILDKHAFTPSGSHDGPFHTWCPPKRQLAALAANAQFDAEIADALTALAQANARSQRKRVTRLVREHKWTQEMIKSNGRSITSKKDKRRFRMATKQHRAAHAQLDPSTGKPLTYKNCMQGPDREKWEEANSKEFRRLLEKYKTMHFIKKGQIPKDKKPTYYSPQVKVKIDEHGKPIEYRVRGTVGGDKIDYAGDVAALTADMTTIKLLLNATASSPGARWMTADISDFYLTGTKLDSPEYMRIQLRDIPLDIQKEFGIFDPLADQDRDCAYVEITGGMYGLPQAGKIAQRKLLQHLATKGYHPAPNTPCLIRHETRDITFALVVDDFGIKYTKDEDADHHRLRHHRRTRQKVHHQHARIHRKATCQIHAPGDQEKGQVTYHVHPS